MKTWLINLCLGLAGWLGWAPVDVSALTQRIKSLETDALGSLIPSTYVARATELTLTVNPAFGGEAKRHQVYARLIKDFPDAPKRELSLAIELALFQSSKEG